MSPGKAVEVFVSIKAKVMTADSQMFRIRSVCDDMINLLSHTFSDTKDEFQTLSRFWFCD